MYSDVGRIRAYLLTVDGIGKSVIFLLFPWSYIILTTFNKLIIMEPQLLAEDSSSSVYSVLTRLFGFLAFLPFFSCYFSGA